MSLGDCGEYMGPGGLWGLDSTLGVAGATHSSSERL